MTHYSTAAETAALIQTATPEQTWLQAQLERIDPHCLEQGHDGAYTRALEALVIEIKAQPVQPAPKGYFEEQPDGTIIPVDPSEMQPDLIPQESLFVCGQMGANVTKVYAEPQPVKQDPLAQTCGVCGYTGNNPDSLGQCPRCHWDELVPTVGNGLRSALNAMLTQFGMDEDEWNKPTFDQARAALAAPPEPLVDIKQMQEIIRDVHQHIQQGHLSEEFVAKQRPGYGTGVYTHIYHQMCKLSGLLKPIQAPQPVIGMQTLHDAITADPSLCDIDEPQPVKQESWITAARLVVEATPEQLPMAIDALRDLVEGAKP